MKLVWALVAAGLGGVVAGCGGHSEAPASVSVTDAGGDATVGGGSGGAGTEGGSSGSGGSGSSGSSGGPRTDGGSSSSGGPSTDGGSTGSSGGDGGPLPPLPGGSCATALLPCTDFPPAPIVDPNGNAVGADPASVFGPANSGSQAGGPCLLEPADGALYPKNWARPRISWVAGAGQTIFEVRVHSDFEAHDLVVYTSNTEWTMDAATWYAIAWAPPAATGGVAHDGDLIGSTLTVTVRASTGTGTPTTSNVAKMMIAPALAAGTISYFATSSPGSYNGDNRLSGFAVGDEGSTLVLTPVQVLQQVRAEPGDGGNLNASFQQVVCVGCHTATPDGLYVGFTAQWPWPNALASLQPGVAGGVPPWLTGAAVQNLSPNYRGDAYDTWYLPAAQDQISLGMGTFSEAHYRTGDRIYVTTLGAEWTTQAGISDPGVASGVTSQLAWFNLEWPGPTSQPGALIANGLPVATPCSAATSYPGIVGSAMPCIPAPVSNGGWGIVSRAGDPNGAGSPSASHGVGGTDAIAYASTNLGVKDGRMDCSVAGPSCVSDIYVVPYASNGPGLGAAGGLAKGLPGAADLAYSEYYPAWSPDDQLIAFNRVPSGMSMYNQPLAEVFVVPYNAGAGGTPTSVTSAFPPPACSNPSGGGVQNTWPRWSPNPLDATNARPTQVDRQGNRYGWIAFSSTRNPRAGGRPQIYVSGVVTAADGSVRAYAPIYAWGQDSTVNNFLPEWSPYSSAPPFSPPPSP